MHKGSLATLEGSFVLCTQGESRTSCSREVGTSCRRVSLMLRIQGEFFDENISE